MLNYRKTLNYGPASDILFLQVVIEGPLELPLVDRCVLPHSDGFLWWRKQRISNEEMGLLMSKWLFPIRKGGVSIFNHILPAAALNMPTNGCPHLSV